MRSYFSLNISSRVLTKTVFSFDRIRSILGETHVIFNRSSWEELLLLLIHTFSVLSLQLNKLR